ncbi:MAG: ligase-associated DNA damage response endonuclease PdeM [Kiloniellales bacterium]|nr:ligase-associated DNA damage response endonuclease PdeM [Kiloniellales bacterium]
MTNPQSHRPRSPASTRPIAAAKLLVNGTELRADISGALYWPAKETLVVSDLHLEKASSFAAFGHLLPPYDTAATLRGLEALVARLRPARVVSLGDSFHDPAAAERLNGAAAERIRALTRNRDWIWICGNHDPLPPKDWGGEVAPELVLGPLIFRHEALVQGPWEGEVSGHYHPKASVRVRARRLTARCFVTDGRRLILPAFGAFTGGLDVLSPSIARHFAGGFIAHLLGRDRIFAFPSAALAGRTET